MDVEGWMRKQSGFDQIYTLAVAIIIVIVNFV